MVWGRTSDRDTHSERSRALTDAYATATEGKGSLGGAPIWNMRAAYMPDMSGLIRLSRHTAHQRDGVGRQFDPEADVDGFAVFGRYPKGFLAHVVKVQLLGDVRRDDILHICSGTLSESERWTVDLRAEARPRVQASGTALPFRDGSFAAVMLDPPYSDEYAKNLYGIQNPRPAWLLKEAARVVAPGGRIGMLHFAVPFSPPDCRLVNVYGVSTGVGFRIRAFTVYEREQAGLFAESAAAARAEGEAPRRGA